LTAMEYGSLQRPLVLRKATSGTSKPSHLDLLGFRTIPTVQSIEGLQRGSRTPDWAAYLTYVGWWIAGLPVASGTAYCVLKVPTRSYTAALVAFGALLRSASEPFGVLTWAQVQSLEEGTRVFLRIADKLGKKHTRSGCVQRSSYLGMVQIDVVDPKYTHWITKPMFHKFEVRLTEHETSRRISKAGSVLSRIIPDFTTEWIHTPTTCCAVVTSQAQWRHELPTIAIAAGRDSATFADFMAPSVDDVSRVDVRPAARAGSVTCKFVILDGPQPFLSRDAVHARRVVILLDALEYQKHSGDVALMLASRDDALLAGSLQDPIFETAVFVSAGP